VALNISHCLVHGLADVRPFGKPQQVVKASLRSQVEDALSLIGGWVFQTRSSAAAGGLFLQHGPAGEEPDLSETQENQTENRLRVLGRREAGVRSELIRCGPEAAFERVGRRISFGRSNPLHIEVVGAASFCLRIGAKRNTGRTRQRAARYGGDGKYGRTSPDAFRVPAFT
jgi:hypothetical protein